MADDFKDKVPPPEKSIIVKNVLFGIFIVLSVIFCFQKYNQRAQKAEFREGLRLFNHAVELFNADETKNQAFIEFNNAETYFEDSLTSSQDTEGALEASQMMAQCFAMMAQCPNVPGEQSIEFYKKALAADMGCPLVDEAIRLKYVEEISPAAMPPAMDEGAPAIPPVPAEVPAPTEAPAPAAE